MSYESHIHDAQVAILRHLLFVPHAGFAELQKQTDLTSDHFNFHVKKLLEANYVEKSGDHYTLTPRGKEYANRMDTDENEIEKQPKISVVLMVERTRNGQREFLAQERLKQPYYGFWGRPSGKVRWGESFEEAATRELAEETGLDAEFTYKLLYHKRDYDTHTGKLLEDKVFLIMHTADAHGTFVEDFEGGHNEWLTHDEFAAKDKKFGSAEELIDLVDAGKSYFAKEYTYDKNEY